MAMTDEDHRHRNRNTLSNCDNFKHAIFKINISGARAQQGSSTVSLGYQCIASVVLKKSIFIARHSAILQLSCASI